MAELDPQAAIDKIEAVEQEVEQNSRLAKRFAAFDPAPKARFCSPIPRRLNGLIRTHRCQERLKIVASRISVCRS